MKLKGTMFTVEHVINLLQRTNTNEVCVVEPISFYFCLQELLLVGS